MAPFSRYKAYTTEGGIRAPAFVSYPEVVKEGKVVANFVSVMDVMPTVLELAGIEHPGTRYKNKDVLPMQGKSMLSFLRGEAEYVHDANEVMGWELFNKRAIRQGNWKIVFMPEPDRDARWQLFNVEVDLAEQHDLAAEQPAKLQQMIDLWKDYERDNGVIISDPLSRY
jgi:arylsulfatase